MAYKWQLSLKDFDESQVASNRHILVKLRSLFERDTQSLANHSFWKIKNDFIRSFICKGAQDLHCTDSSLLLSMKGTVASVIVTYKVYLSSKLRTDAS